MVSEISQPVLSFLPGNSVSESEDGDEDEALTFGEGTALESFSVGLDSLRRGFTFDYQSSCRHWNKIKIVQDVAGVVIRIFTM
jgi:hypothetical protein